MNITTRNVFISIVAAIMVLSLTFLILSVTYFPMEEQERKKIISEKCPNGVETCGLIIESSPIVFVLMIPSIVTYILLLHYLEKKKPKEEKSWRSYR